MSCEGNKNLLSDAAILIAPFMSPALIFEVINLDVYLASSDFFEFGLSVKFWTVLRSCKSVSISRVFVKPSMALFMLLLVDLPSASFIFLCFEASY